MKENYLGTYKVRRDARGEQMIHAPATVTGDFALYLSEDGTMKYVPMGTKGGA